MRQAIHGIRWFVRRSTDPQSLGEFYRDVVGFPELRRYGATAMLWLGDTVDLEPGGGATLLPPSRDWDKAPCLPIIQVGDLAGVTGRLKASGLQFAAENLERADGVISWFIDTAGNATGLLEKRPAVAEPASWEPAMADRAGSGWRSPDLIRLCEVVRRGEDTASLIAFYRDVVGLETRESDGNGGDLLTLGEKSVLRIVPGGSRLTVPNDRYDVVDAFILHVDDMDGVVADLERQGTHVINQPFDIEGGRIAYLTDPEGQVFGVQTRLPTTNRVEDHEAFRRHAESR